MHLIPPILTIKLGCVQWQAKYSTLHLPASKRCMHTNPFNPFLSSPRVKVPFKDDYPVVKFQAPPYVEFGSLCASSGVG